MQRVVCPVCLSTMPRSCCRLFWWWCVVWRCSSRENVLWWCWGTKFFFWMALLFSTCLDDFGRPVGSPLLAALWAYSIRYVFLWVFYSYLLLAAPGLWSVLMSQPWCSFEFRDVLQMVLGFRTWSSISEWVTLWRSWGVVPPSWCVVLWSSFSAFHWITWGLLPRWPL